MKEWNSRNSLIWWFKPINSINISLINVKSKDNQSMINEYMKCLFAFFESKGTNNLLN